MDEKKQEIISFLKKNSINLELTDFEGVSCCVIGGCWMTPLAQALLSMVKVYQKKLVKKLAEFNINLQIILVIK